MQPALLTFGKIIVSVTLLTGLSTGDSNGAGDVSGMQCL